LSRGEFDVRMTVDRFVPGKSLNYTKVSNNANFLSGQYSLNTPRFIDQMNIYPGIYF
jgi:hypothetical protein